jgi:hypothetical protein
LQPGDIIRLNNQGQAARLVLDVEPRQLENVIEQPPGTFALVLEVWNSDERDGPSMESYAKVMVDGNIGYVWLYECEEVR